MLRVLRGSPTLDATNPYRGGCFSPNDCKRRKRTNQNKKKTYLTVCKQDDVLPPRTSTPQPAPVAHAVEVTVTVTRCVSKAIPYTWPTYLTHHSVPLRKAQERCPAVLGPGATLLVQLQSSQYRETEMTDTHELEGGGGAPRPKRNQL